MQFDIRIYGLYEQSVFERLNEDLRKQQVQAHKSQVVNKITLIEENE